ncbi:MAG: UDP-N-acetylglucosamine 4,6-dehydratase (inverting) [Acidobacteria bacterium]|nr:UDP-N-acetylglucosamine 4,6-dehydratase (inverting) [Acidobacteriota bacterium]
MLGHKLWQQWQKRFDCRVTVRGRAGDYADLPFFDESRVIENFDAARLEDVDRAIAESRADVVVNCIGIVKQLPAAQDAITAITINSLLPHHAARACHQTGSRFIQVSTDCVFSGRKGSYREWDNPDPSDLYGRSKLMGEVEAPSLTVRTSIVGRELGSINGLLEWFLTRRGTTVKGYTRAVFSGLTTLELARVLAEVIETSRDLEGIYHVASEPISKFDLLKLFNDGFQGGIAIETDATVSIDRTLDGTRFRQATGIAIPSWPQMVAELAADSEPYEAWRAR